MGPNIAWFLHIAFTPTSPCDPIAFDRYIDVRAWGQGSSKCQFCPFPEFQFSSRINWISEKIQNSLTVINSHAHHALKTRITLGNDPTQRQNESIKVWLRARAFYLRGRKRGLPTESGEHWLLIRRWRWEKRSKSSGVEIEVWG